MKTISAFSRITIPMFAAALVGVPALLGADERGAYFRGGAGVAFADDTRLEEFFAEPVAGANVEFDTGFRMELAAGYNLCDWFGAEFETGYIFNSVDSVTGAVNGDLSLGRVPFLVNVVFQLPNRTRFVPFIGAGGGGATGILRADEFRIGGTMMDGDASTFAGAYQGFAGLRYNLNDQMMIGLMYKYLWVGEMEFEPELLVGTFGDMQFDSTETHSFTLTFSMRF